MAIAGDQASLWIAPSLPCIEHVPDAPHCFQKGAGYGGEFDLPSQAADISVDVSRRHETGFPPDLVEELLAGKDPPRPAGQEVQQIELLLGQR